MAIVETSWQKFLATDSQIPPDVFFLVTGEDEGNNSSKPIGAHRILLGGVSPVFMGLLFGPMKDMREVIEVKDTTHEAFNTMINYIYKSPGSSFFPVPDREFEYSWRRMGWEGWYEEDDEEEDFSDDKIGCPQKFFELLNLANMYQILGLKRELASNALDTLAITKSNVIFAATVAKNYRKIFEEVSTKMLVKCLKFLVKKNEMSGDWTKFWGLVNTTEDSEEVLPLKERLAGTPFVNLVISHHTIKASLDRVGNTSYEKCLYLAFSGVHVR